MAVVAIGLKVAFTSHAHCDEYSTHGTLAFNWQSTLRTHDGFGPIHGTFSYADGEGNVATGSAIGTIGSGTHRLPNLGDCESCRVPLHFEGTF
jgi:hypothetical protein